MFVKQKLNAWSYSRWSVYELCPFKCKCANILRIKEPTTPPLERGGRIHDGAADYIAKRRNDIIEELMGREKMLKEFRKYKGRKFVEEMWGFDNRYVPCRWDDWKKCWLRVKLDFALIRNNQFLEITDWKTGQFRPEEVVSTYHWQLELYGLAGLKKFPGVREVHARLVFTDQDEIYPLMFTRKEENDLQIKWDERIKDMLADTKFEPRRNAKCKWCFYRSGNKAAGGGQCTEY